MTRPAPQLFHASLRFRAAAALAAACALWSPACKDKARAPAASGADGAVPGVLNAPPPDEEVEPNDRPEQATSILPDKLVQGRISARPGQKAKGRDVDHYLLTSQFPKGVLRVEVTGVPGLDLVVEAWQKTPRKKLGTAQNGGAGAGESLPNIGVAAGEHLIVVREGGRKPSGVEAPYTLRATITPAQPGDEQEPNDTRPDAQEVAVGQTITGYYGRRRDVDWYRIKLPENVQASNLRVELTGLQSVPFATLIAQDEIEVVLKKGTTGRGTNVLFPNVAVRTGQRLVYLVTSGGKRYSPADKYTLTTQLTPASADDEREPNDRTAQATPLRAGQNIKGYVSPAGDEDFYALDVAAPSIARIGVTGVENVDLTLTVLDAAGKTLLVVDDGGMRDGEVVPNAFLPTGRAYVRVAGKKRQENVFATYELTATLKAPDPAEEREPNDIAARAGALSMGGLVRGYVYPKSDVDVYALDVPAVGPQAKTVRFELKGIPKVPLELIVKDPTGAAIARAAAKNAEDAVTLEKPIPPGKYFVEVKSAAPGLSNPRDAYELRVAP